MVLKLSNNYIRSNIAIKQVNRRFILILERYKMIKSISEEEKSGSQIIECSPISQYITRLGILVLKFSNFLPYHNISHYCESEYYIQAILFIGYDISSTITCFNLDVHSYLRYIDVKYYINTSWYLHLTSVKFKYNLNQTFQTFLIVAQINSPH